MTSPRHWKQIPSAELQTIVNNYERLEIELNNLKNYYLEYEKEDAEENKRLYEHISDLRIAYAELEEEKDAEIERLGRLLLRQDQMLTEQDEKIERLNGIIDRLRIAYAELKAEKRDV